MTGIFNNKSALEQKDEDEKLFDDKHKIKENSEYNKMIPIPSIDEKDEMRKSLEKHGQKYPLIVDSQTFDLVDGYTRFKLLIELGIKVWYKLKYFATKRDILYFILISNVHRRHLRPFDKVRLFRPLYDKEKELAQKRLKEIGKHQGKGGKAIIKFSEKIGVSPDTASKAITILDKGTPSQIKMVKEKLVSVTSMDRIIKKKQVISMDDQAHRYYIIVKNSKGKTVEKYTRNLTDRNYNHMINYLRTI